jgi:hypothetical protein
VRSLSVVLLAVFVLVACGGGGSGDTLSLSLSPSSLTGTVYQGQAATYHIVGMVSGSLPSSLYIEVLDPGAAFQSPIVISRQADGTYATDLAVSTGLNPGEYKNTLTVYLCGDSQCAQKLASASINYDIKLVSNTNLTALTPLAGAGDWTTIGGSSAHTGFVPITLNAAQFSPRWRYTLLAQPLQNVILPEVTTANGSVYFLEATYTTGNYSFDVLQESDGSAIYGGAGASGSVAGCSYVSGLTLSGSQAFASAYRCGTGTDTRLYAWNAATAAIQSATPYPHPPTGDATSSAPPTVLNGVVAVAGTDIGEGTTGFDPNTSLSQWSTPDGGLAGSSLATDASHLYAAGTTDQGGTLALLTLDPASGSLLSSANLQITVPGPITPVVAGTDAVISAWTSLIDVDTVTQTVKWSVAGNYQQRPAIANGVVYVVDNVSGAIQLEARNLKDGTLLWTWSAGAPKFTTLGYDNQGAPIVTNNLVLLSTDGGVNAVDLGTHQSVWSYPWPGRLALSANGILYVSREASSGFTSGQIISDGYLAAINLH